MVRAGALRDCVVVLIHGVPLVWRRLSKRCSTLTSTFSLRGPTFFDGTNFLYYPSLSTALGYTFSISLWITPQAIPLSSVLVRFGSNKIHLKRIKYRYGIYAMEKLNEIHRMEIITLNCWRSLSSPRVTTTTRCSTH